MYELKYTRQQAARETGWSKCELALIIEKGYIETDQDGFISFEDTKILSNRPDSISRHKPEEA